MTQITPYAASSDTVIASSARAIGFVFSNLAHLDDGMIQQVQSLADPSTTPSAAADRQAQLQSDTEQTWSLLIQGVVFATYCAIRADPHTGRMSRLALTSGQRKEVLEVLRARFGPRVLTGANADYHPVEGAARLLYVFLSDPKRESRTP